MSASNTDFDLLCDDYLHGAMTPAEKAEFEASLSSDPGQHAHWQEYLLLVQGVREFGRRQTLERWYDEIHGAANDDKESTEDSSPNLFQEWKKHQKTDDGQQQNRPGGTFRLFRFISAAAVIAVVFYIGWHAGGNVEPEVGHRHGFEELATLTLPVVELGSEPGSAGTSEEKWAVTIQKNELPEYVAILANRELTLLLPLDQAPLDIRLRRLDDLGGKVVFLGIHDNWYRLRTDVQREQILQAIQDNTVLSRLK